MPKGLLRGLVLALLILSGALFVLIGRIVFLSPTIEDESSVSIGGPFHLTDHMGHRVSDTDFRGHLMLIYFGYTYCPDVCPTELQTMSVALDALGPRANLVQPIFITIDPARDRPEVLAQYVSNFHPSLIGLTGEAADIQAAASVYRVYFSKAPGASGADADYLMDHSSFIYLMGQDGRYLTHFSSGSSPEKIAEGISRYLP